MKDFFKISLTILLFIILFINKFNVNRQTYNTLVTLCLAIFISAVTYDLMLGLLIISISYVLFTKINIKEKFNVKNSKDANKKNIKEQKKVTESPPTDKKDKKVTFKETDEVFNPEHCQNIKDIDNEFMSEFHVEKKKLDIVQNNVFDKYNYNVFYNELGENSLDIQGIYNHEVLGYETN